MKFLKTIHSAINKLILMIAKKKILSKLEVCNLDVETLTLYEFNSLVKIEEYIVVCDSKKIGSDIAIGIFLGMGFMHFCL